MTEAMRLALPLFFAVGCVSEELPGSYFNVDRVGAENGCTGNGTNFSERMAYRIEYHSNEVVLAVGEDVWATGISDGCTVTYDSIVWTSNRNGHTIDWQVSGEAQVDPDGGNTCSSELDWKGTETYFITNSEHPDVNPGCEYVLDVRGKHSKTVE